MNKKSQIGLWIGIVIALIIVIALVVTIIIGYNKGWFKDKDTDSTEQKYITIKVRLWEDEKEQYTSGHYSLRELPNYNLLRKGDLDSSWNELSKIPQNKTLAFNYWNDDYYTDTSFFSKSLSFRNYTISKEDGSGTLEKTMKKGRPVMEVIGNLEKGKTKNITLNVTAVNGTIKKVSFCIYHTLGIISIKNPQMVITCNGQWYNWTYDIDNNIVNLTDYSPYLYQCREQNRLEYCSKVSDDICYIQSMKTPTRLSSEVDFCFYTGKSLRKYESYLLPLEINTMEYFSETDYMDIYILDQELQPYNNKYRYEDLEGNDVGIADYLFTI